MGSLVKCWPNREIGRLKQINEMKNRRKMKKLKEIAKSESGDKLVCRLTTKNLVNEVLNNE